MKTFGPAEKFIYHLSLDRSIVRSWIGNWNWSTVDRTSLPVIHYDRNRVKELV